MTADSVLITLRLFWTGSSAALFFPALTIGIEAALAAILITRIRAVIRQPKSSTLRGTMIDRTMTNRRNLLSFSAPGGALTIALPGAARAADACPSPADASALLDRIVTAFNAFDLAALSSLYTEGHIQHSGRNPSGLSAQIANVQRQHETWPDIHFQVEDRIIAADKVVARCLYAATHTKTVRGFAPTGRKISFTTIDIWRVEDGKFAEHWDVVDFAALDKQLAGA